MPKIISHRVVYRSEETYSTFPWIVRVGDALIVAFRQTDGVTKRSAETAQVSHHDVRSWIAAVASYDEGKTWDPATHKVIYRSAFGVNDPGLTPLPDGSLLLRVSELDVKPSHEREALKGAFISHRVELGLVSALRANVVQRLSGSDWTPFGPAIDVNAGALTASCTREPVLILPDGSWVLSVYAGAPFGTDKSYLIRSYDQGVTWPDASVMVADTSGAPSDQQGANFNETGVLCFPDGEMVAAARCDDSFHSEGQYIPVGGVGNLRIARSFNWGLSWTRPEPTPIFGQPAHLLQLEGDTVLCTYGYRRKPYGVRAAISRDRGRTWDMPGEVILRDDGALWDLGYPVSIRLKNGNIFSVYYFVANDGVRHIAATEWSL